MIFHRALAGLLAAACSVHAVAVASASPATVHLHQRQNNTRSDDVSIAAVQLHFGDGQCSEDQRRILREEFDLAQQMAIAAKNNPRSGPYYDHFFDAGSRGDGAFEQRVKDIYSRIEKMLSGTEPDFTIVVHCDQTTRGCARKGWMAHMNADTQVMNFCNKFFDEAEGIKPTNSVLGQCGNLHLRDAQRSRASVVVHECSHTNYAMGGDGTATLDYAYGFNGCSKLAAGIFDRSCVPYANPRKLLCADPNNPGQEGICGADRSTRNADTYSFIATGVWFTERCSREIPFPPPAETITDAKCALDKDYIVIDGAEDDEDELSVMKYVHFGDSYASGMGTGTTSGDSCRVGSNNYGKLMHEWLEEAQEVDWSLHSCSGDTTIGLNGKIDQWDNDGNVTLGTLTIGGNDLGFSDLVYHCVITPNTGNFGFTERLRCIESENKARDHMRDGGENGLRAKLRDSYTRILEKADRRDFHLYVAGYPTFFNEETTDCDKATFHYWWASNRPSWDLIFNRIVYLTRNLRKELDDLVRELNTVIVEAIDGVNGERGISQVHFVDVNSRFDNGAHRWCEGGVKDPDAGRKDTWFFLSGWADVDVRDATEETAVAEGREAFNFFQGKTEIVLPPVDGCAGADPAARGGMDPYDIAMCRVAEEIKQNPNGEQARRHRRANEDVKNGQLTTEDVSWYLPTRQIKTFHPRTPGMRAYRDAIIEAIQDNGGF